MLRILFGLLVFISLTSSALFAETVQIDTDGWTQEQKNMIHAMAVRILADNSITYDGIYANNVSGVIDVTNPSGSLSVLNKANIQSYYDTWKAASDIATAQAIAYEQSKQTELSGNLLTNIRLDSIDARIDSDFDAATTLAQLRAVEKAYWKRLIRYLKAKE